MKTTINLYDFERAFADCGRADSFSYAGLRALFEYLEELEESTGEELELDVIGLCCDFAEYSSALEAAEEYGFKPADSLDDEEEREEEALEWLRNHTTVILVEGGGVIIQNF